MAQKIIATLKQSALYLTLNRPEKLNCLDQDMLLSLEDHLSRAEQNDEVRVVVLQGAGTRAFSSGADLKAFAALADRGIADWIQLGHRVFAKVDAFPKPTIAAIQGYAMGGGLELALACDFRLASEDAILQFPELQHGWLPGWGGMSRLKRILGEARSLQMILLSEQISAPQGYEWGLLTHCCPGSGKSLEEATQQLIEKLTAINPKAVSLAKATMKSAHPENDRTWFDVLALQQLLEENKYNK